MENEVLKNLESLVGNVGLINYYLTEKGKDAFSNIANNYKTFLESPRTKINIGFFYGNRKTLRIERKSELIATLERLYKKLEISLRKLNLEDRSKYNEYYEEIVNSHYNLLEILKSPAKRMKKATH